MYTISKEFHFSSSHQLTHLPVEHPCSRVHGHNYIVIVELSSEKLNEDQFVVDYRELNPIKVWIDTVLDHMHLNDVLDFQPTAENIAKWIFNLWKHDYPLSAITVQETPKTMARYSPLNDEYPDTIGH